MRIQIITVKRHDCHVSECTEKSQEVNILSILWVIKSLTFNSCEKVEIFIPNVK